MKKLIISVAIFCSFSILAQAITTSQLPPIWKGNNQYAQFSELTDAYISPTRIVWSDVPEGAIATNLDNLLKPGKGQAVLVKNAELIHLKNAKEGKVSILLDFGKQIQGGLQIVTGAFNKAGVNVQVCFGESVSEAMSAIGDGNGSTNDHAMRDFIMPLPFLGVAEAGNTGFRFVRVDLLGANANVKIQEIRARFTYRDIPYRGSFECDNQRLNDIWMTGAYTVHVNMQDYLWDGIKRDRLVWLGDLHPEVMAINSVFGYNEVVPKSLDLIRNVTPLPDWMNGISSYSIWWLIIHRDWYKYHGDLEYLKEQQAYMKHLVQHLMTKIGSDGREKLDGMRFLDWPSKSDKLAVQAGLQSLMLMSMEVAEELFMLMDDETFAAECAEAANKLRSYVLDHNNSKQAAALMALAGLMEAEDANREVLAVDGSARFSTFYGYYMLEAMAAAGNYQGAMDVISEYWGAMLDLGATTFWEDFDMEWTKNAGRIDEIVPEGKVDVHAAYGNYCYKQLRHSLCHGWAAGPTAWLSHHVLGVKVLEPGCTKIEVLSHLGDLQWAKGTFPTPKGDVQISHVKNETGEVQTKVKAPRGVKVIVK